MTLYGLNQLLTEPTHILEHTSSCIDLIFTNQPNLIRGSGIHPTLHPTCHHQLIYSKLNLKIEYPSLYTREIWNYNRAETDLINRSIESFDRSKLFLGKETRLSCTLNNTIFNIFRNLIPNKLIFV